VFCFLSNRTASATKSSNGKLLSVSTNEESNDVRSKIGEIIIKCEIYPISKDILFRCWQKLRWWTRFRCL